MAKREADTGPSTQTTGHAWDGIEELNTPLPRWWLWTFYATIVWAFAYWIFYPAWPTISGYTTGVLGYTNRGQVAVDLADLQAIRGAKGAALQQVSLADIEKDPALLAFAQAEGKAAFGNNCAPCHGVGATGAKGYPNLNDDAPSRGSSRPLPMGCAPAMPRPTKAPCRRSARIACSSPTRSWRSPITCAHCPGFRSVRASTSQRARRSLPTTAPPATAPTAPAIRNSARPTLPTASGCMVRTNPAQTGQQNPRSRQRTGPRFRSQGVLPRVRVTAAHAADGPLSCCYLPSRPASTRAIRPSRSRLRAARVRVDQVLG